jgi:hypothetical protein
MRSLFLSLFIFVFAFQSSAQNSFKKTTLYGEIGGNGLFLSANYERQMGNKPGFGLHVGIGIADIMPAIPLGITYMLDLGNNKSFVETGAGITLAERYTWDTHSLNRPPPHPYKAGFIPSIGYRHHTAYGLMWRINYTPIFTQYRNIPLFLGISIGWRI